MNSTGDIRYGKSGFEPPWDWCEQHKGGWHEIVRTVGNDGFAYIVFVPGKGIDPRLLDLCGQPDLPEHNFKKKGLRIANSRLIGAVPDSPQGFQA